MKNNFIKSFRAEVVAGRKVGSKIGFPTINLKVSPDAMDGLGQGVYVCVVCYDEKKNLGVMHFGPRPTFLDAEFFVEIHLLDFDEDLYGKKVMVRVYNKLRGIKKFADVEELKKQITKDVARCRSMINVQFSINVK